MGKGKAKVRKRSVPRDLTASSAKAIKGGSPAITARKAGKGQQEYYGVKLSDNLISS